MSTPAFRQIVTNMSNFSVSVAAAGGTSLIGGVYNDSASLLSKYFLLRNLSITGYVNDIDFSGVINFDGFPPNERCSLAGGLGDVNGIYGSFSSGTILCQLSVVFVYYGPGQYALVPSFQITDPGDVIVSRWDNAPFGLTRWGTNATIFGVTTPIWYDARSGTPAPFLLSVDDSASDAYFLPTDFDVSALGAGPTLG